MKEQLIPLKICQYRGNTEHLEFRLLKRKMLIGRFEGADIHLNHEEISHYHAFIILEENGSGRIIDLASDNGIFINNKRVNNAYFSPGDVLRFGTLEFHVEEFISAENHPKEKIRLMDDDAQTTKVADHDLDLIIPDLPPMPGLVLIDGEYCDVTFDESHSLTTGHIPVIAEKIEFDYIDIDETKEVLPILRKNQNQAIEVLVTSNGHILSVDYFLVQNKTYYVSSVNRERDVLFLPILAIDEDIAFIQCSNNGIVINQLPGLKCFRNDSLDEEIFKDSDSYQLKESDQNIHFYSGTVKVTIRQVEAPPHMRAAPFFGRDKAFQWHTTKIVSGILSVMLLLLLVDTSIPLKEEEKKIAVIYRQAPEDNIQSDIKSSESPAEKDLDQGIKQEPQPVEQVRMAKKSPPKASPQRAETAAAPEPAPSQAVANEVKGYKFELKSSIASLASKSNQVKNVDINKNSRGVASTASFDASTNKSAAASINPTQGTSESVGTLGSDNSGAESRSTGAQGLSSKKGINTSYVEPKTVVLGSMDPELLRKILQEYLPQFRHCYQRELDKSEQARGVVDLEFRIEKDGRVSRVDIKGKQAKFSPTGVDCMARVLRMIDFPKPKGGGLVDVKQPLNFFSEKQKI